jgi:heavy metal sensor kinase
LKRQFSISIRLTALFGTVFLVGWLFFGGAMWLTLKRTLHTEREQTLIRRMDRLQTLLLRDEGMASKDRYEDFRDFASATGNGLSEVFGADGQRVWPSPSGAAAAFRWPDAKQLTKEQFVEAQVSSQPYLIIQRPYVDSGKQLVLMAAAPEAGNLLLLSNFLHGMVTIAPVLLAISMVGGYWTSRRALLPVDRIATAARSISIRNLSERVPMPGSRDELQRLAETFNEMLARLDMAVRRLKQFTADASHELRGPISLTRTIAEVALRQPGHMDDTSRTALEGIVEESAKATILLEHMLELARADSGSVNMALEPVDLNEVAAESYRMATRMAEEKQIKLHLSPQSEVPQMVLGNASSLRRLAWILLDNALKYTQTGGSIRVSVGTQPERPSFSVQDDGMGIAEEDLPHIFDRFYRADPSRASVEGNGLGLAIAKWIVDIHRAHVVVTSRLGEGSSFTVEFSEYP